VNSFLCELNGLLHDIFTRFSLPKNECALNNCAAFTLDYLDWLVFGLVMNMVRGVEDELLGRQGVD